MRTPDAPLVSFASLREALLLEDAARTAARYGEGARVRMRALVRAARDRAHVAERVAEGHPRSALSLYREAALLYMTAFVAVESPEPPPQAAEELLARFVALRPRRSAPGDLEALVAHVGVAPEAPRSGDADARSAAQADDARALVRWLGGLVEPRGLAELRFVRRVRVALASVAALALLAWALSGLGGSPNLALHKPVTTSGVFAASSAAPGGLTDGVITGAPYGVHTDLGPAPWAQVDLLAVHRVSKVKIYNRGDNYFDEGLPMTLQVSDNGITFVDVETRTAPFSQESPWIAKLRGRSARYVRVRGRPGKYVTLSELEVY